MAEREHPNSSSTARPPTKATTLVWTRKPTAKPTAHMSTTTKTLRTRSLRIRPAVTWVVDRLEERGVAERRGLPEDRRIKTVAITPAGEKIKAELLKRIYEPADEILTLTRPELLALIDLLQKLAPSTMTSTTMTSTTTSQG